MVLKGHLSIFKFDEDVLHRHLQNSNTEDSRVNERRCLPGNNCVHVCQVIGRIKRGYLKCEPETNSAVYGAGPPGHHHNVFVSSGEAPEDHCVHCK